jgi:hypothetical protein
MHQLAITLQLPSALKNIVDILPPILFTLLPIKPSHQLAYKFLLAIPIRRYLEILWLLPSKK